MTTQEAFDTIVRKLHAQGRSAQTDAGACSYRTSDGRGCAVGVLMTDEDIARLMKHGPRFMSKTVTSLREAGVLPAHLEELGPAFLRGMQFAHDVDATCSPGAWWSRFLAEAGNTAVRFSLDASVLAECATLKE